MILTNRVTCSLKKIKNYNTCILIYNIMKIKTLSNNKKSFLILHLCDKVTEKVKNYDII